MPAGLAAALAAAAVTALMLAPAALAHARPIATLPADGAVLATAPDRVTVTFDDAVIATAGAAAIRNSSGDSVLAGPQQAAGRVVTLPLAANLEDGDYTVRWRVLGDDGHLLEGIVAFAVGEGRAPPRAELPLLGSGPRWAFVLARWLLVGGALLALGGGLFRWLVLRRPRGAGGAGATAVPGAHSLDGRFLTAQTAAFTAALAGAGLSLVAVPDVLDTRFGTAALGAIAAAAVGIALSEVGRSTGRWPLAALPAAVALAATVVAGSHALDPPAGLRPLKAATDTVHLGAAAVWVGGIGMVALLASRLAPEERSRALRRFGLLAGGAVAVTAATGIGRAAFGLSSAAQAWDTGYGRLLLAKTVLLAVALVAALAVRRTEAGAGDGPAGAASPTGGDSPTGARRRGSPALVAELVAVAALVALVAVLADTRPGRDSTRTALPEAAAVRTSPPLPAPDAVVLARQEGDLAFAVAIRALGPSRLELTATVLAPDGRGEDGLAVALGADAPPRATARCGSGCYAVVVAAPERLRTVTVAIGGSARPAFQIQEWPPVPADGLVARVTRRFEAQRAMAFTERLASSTRSVERSSQRVVAPDRFAFDIDGGPSGIVIGPTRWTRLAGSTTWERIEVQPLTLPKAGWGTTPRNAFAVGRTTIGGRPVRVVTLLDPAIPAWHTVYVDEQRLLPLRVDMTASAHFMVDRYTAFGAGIEIEPPPPAVVEP